MRGAFCCGCVMRSAEWDAWVSRARAVPIEAAAANFGIELKGRGTHRAGPCPVCGGVDRFSLNVKKQLFHCRGCQRAGDVIALVEYLDNCDFQHACEVLTGEPPPKPKHKANGKGRGKPARKIQVAEFLYHDSDGKLALSVVRYEFKNSDGTFVLEHGKRKKVFAQRRPDPDRAGEWTWNADGVPTGLLYQLPQLIETVRSGREIVIAEGEGKVNLLTSWGIAATCIPGGAGNVGKWSSEHSEFLRDAHVVLLPDNDDKGWFYSNTIGTGLQGVAGSVKLLLLPGLEPAGDVINWHKQGGTAEQLRALLAEAPEWQPPPIDEGKPDDDDAKKRAAEQREDELLEALKKMPAGIKRSRARKAAAKELGVAMGDIDAAIRALQEEEEIAPLYEHWNVTPWPEPVDGDSLLRDIIRYIKQRVICSDGDALTVALWIMFSWLHDEIAVFSPILLITAAESESGKSTMLTIVAFLIPRAIKSIAISEAGLFRSIARWQPSFAIDEFDKVLSGDDRNGLAQCINAGHTRSDSVIRCIEPNYVPTLFPVFCPKAIAMIGRKLPQATLSRCLIIELRRRLPDETIERFRHEDNPEMAGLRSRLLRWSADNAEALRAASPELPPNFHNRCGDNWSLLLGISDRCTVKDGTDWGAMAREAAVAIEKSNDTTSLAVRLLGDIRRIFDEQLQKKRDQREKNRQPLFDQQEEEKEQYIHTEDLLQLLNADKEGPWAAWNKGKGLSANTLASFLGGGGGRGRSRGGFRIHSENIRGRDIYGNNLQAKGYWRKRFVDAWKRYVPPESEAEEASDD